ncbi:hypothetical protein [Corallococcus llansteffanensis]|uniref:hypothetical protein n=1 Tax=Corallococcus llansteffanensis TaxID=2316731 RepID=UPI0011C37CE2|nr:hypothetical protein [Corallococcus llansteffanensis]
MRRAIPLVLITAWACASSRLYYLRTELLYLEGDPNLAVAPGPWKHPDVPIVLSDAAMVPDDLVLPALKALMALPGAADACDPNSKRPRRDAAEYCVTLYKTPHDWRVSWPIRGFVDEQGACWPAYGGVDDEDFGRDMPIFGFAHNHPCGTPVSSRDLKVFPAMKLEQGGWVVVTYGATPSGRLVRDSRGKLVPAWGWLATGHQDSPRFYKWNPAGRMFRWIEERRGWDAVSTCRPGAPPGPLSPRGSPPECEPEMQW